MTRLLLMCIKGYQYLISPLFPSVCRFSPSCSQFYSEALIKYGFTKGVWLGTKRILRCNPWNAGGYDPVP